MLVLLYRYIPKNYSTTLLETLITFYIHIYAHMYIYIYIYIFQSFFEIFFCLNMNSLPFLFQILQSLQVIKRFW